MEPLKTKTMQVTSIKKVPFVRQQSIKRQTMERLICNRLNWSEAEYNMFQFDAGCAFVSFVLDTLDESERRLITTSSLFWGWWRNEWYVRDTAVYTWPVLNADNYQYVHTLNLRDCNPTINGFWGHVSDFVKEGRKKLIADAGKGADNARY
jgi:hypothetical protein